MPIMAVNATTRPGSECRLALLPLALSGQKPGGEIEAPMAVVILFGLLSSTALNMIVVPTAFYRFRKPKLQR